MLPMSWFSYCNIILIKVILIQVIYARSQNYYDVFSSSRITVKNEPYTKRYDSNVTEIIKLKDSLIQNKFGDGFKDVRFASIYEGMYSVEMYNITNKTGSVLSIDTFFQDNRFLEFFYDDFWRYKNIKTSGVYCNSDQLLPISNYEKKISDCLGIMEYYNIHMKYTYKYSLPSILSISWIPQNIQNYLEIGYILKSNQNFDIYIKIFDEDEHEKFSSKLMTDNNMRKLIIPSEYLQTNTKYKIRFSKTQSSHYYDTVSNETVVFGIFQITNIFPFPHNVNDLTNNTHTMISNVPNKCLNGGYQINNELSCICPPGFQGILCEKGCGPNSYGADCSRSCSVFTKGCRGMYFCTHSYGCTCPVGLTGPFCDQDCSPYKYGADCNQSCSSKCFYNTCDQYTGACSQGCLKGYVPPNCIEKYLAYLLKPPKLISAEYESVNVEINFELENIKDISEYMNVKYYQLLWKALDEYIYTRSEIKLFYTNRTEEVINDLNSDTTYSIGVLLIMEDGYYDIENIIWGQYRTICNNPSFDKSDINVTEGFRSIYVAWDKISISQIECSITELVILLYHEQTNITGTNITVPSSDHGYAILDLIPGNEYSIKVTAKTTHQELQPSLVYKVTPKFTDEDIIIKNVTAIYLKQNGTINISWKPVVNAFGLNTLNDVMINTSLTFIVKYKVRIFSCSMDEIENEWSSITVNGTDCAILDVIPNSQYIIQILLLGSQRENTIYVLTPASLPALEPVLDIESPKYYITNNSISIYWEMDIKNCSKINGFFSKYVIELKELNDNKTIIKETKHKYIYINELKPSTDYEIKVFVKNHVGYNTQHFLLINFKTKYDMVSVDDLVIYKKSIKNRMLGLRWSYSDAEHLDGFAISFNDNSLKYVINETIIPPTVCLAWPDFYCHTFYNISFNNNYTIKVKAKSLDYPDGGKPSSVTCNTIDGIPDATSNFKAIEIGKTNITLQWGIPWIFNGELKSFILNIEETSSADIQSCCESFTPVEIPFGDEQPIYTYTVTNLRPGSMYSIGVLSKTFWYGPTSRIQATTLL